MRHYIGAIIKTKVMPGFCTCVHKRFGVGRRWKTNRFY